LSTPNTECAARMTTFDSLPKPLRVAIAGAAFVCEPREMEERLDRGRSLDRILRGLAAYDRRIAR
jgi:hypothetical protein